MQWIILILLGHAILFGCGCSSRQPRPRPAPAPTVYPWSAHHPRPLPICDGDPESDECVWSDASMADEEMEDR